MKKTVIILFFISYSIAVAAQNKADDYILRNIEIIQKEFTQLKFDTAFFLYNKLDNLVNDTRVIATNGHPTQPYIDTLSLLINITEKCVKLNDSINQKPTPSPEKLLEWNLKIYSYVTNLPIDSLLSGYYEKTDSSGFYKQKMIELKNEINRLNNLLNASAKNIYSLDINKIWWYNLPEVWKKILFEGTPKTQDDFEEIYTKTSVYIPINETIKTLNPLERLINLKSFTCYNENIETLAPLKNLSELKILSIRYCNNINSLDAISNLTNLESLDITGTSITNLSPIANLNNIQSLNLNNTKIKDLNPINQLINITQLYCNKTQITDISLLKNFTKLTTLSIKKNSDSIKIDFKPLVGLKNFNSLSCTYNTIKEFYPLTSFSELSLDIGNPYNPIMLSQMDSLKLFKNLIYFNCQYTSFNDLSYIINNKKLKTLYINNTYVTDLKILNSLTSIRDLNCNNTPITSLEGMENNTELKSLYCSNTKIVDLKPLNNAELQHIEFSRTDVKDISYLNKSKETLNNLDCSHTKIDSLDLSGFTKIGILDISGLNTENISFPDTLNTLKFSLPDKFTNFLDNDINIEINENFELQRK